MKTKNSAKILLIITYFLFVALVAFAVLLPYGATWYTEKMHRSEKLPTVLMCTCYPCLPFAFYALLSIKRIAKSILDGSVLTKKTLKNIYVIGICCFIAGLIMIFVGLLEYFPFFVVSCGAFFCTVISKVFADVFKAYLDTQE